MSASRFATGSPPKQPPQARTELPVSTTMIESDYASFTRQQKLAILLIIIGPEAAAEVMRQFDDTLQKLGVERIKSVGQAFDPAVHEAIQHLETAEFEPGTVAAEYQAGYRIGDRVVRPALVVVAKAASN